MKKIKFENHEPLISKEAFIASGAIIIGRVTIKKGSSIWFGCVIRGDINDINIGEKTNIQDASVLHVNEDGIGLNIGDRVTVGHCCLLHACTIEDNAFIGMHSTIMDNAVVKKGGMLGAGSVLTPGKIIRPGELWLGTPAKPVRMVSEKENQMIEKSAERYINLSKKYLEQL